jgi:hypothetical protein
MTHFRVEQRLSCLGIGAARSHRFHRGRTMQRIVYGFAQTARPTNWTSTYEPI